MNESTLLEKMVTLQATVTGLRTEVEAWRTHTSSTGDFILREVDVLLIALTDFLNELKLQIKQK